MCKLLAIVDIENEDGAIEFSEAAVKPMTQRDDDGLGLIMLGDQGMGIERWLKPAEFPNTQSIPPIMEKYSALIPMTYNTEGEISQTGLYAIGVHSRMATSPKCLENVHPFVREGVALIHNGIISNHNSFAKEVSTCDSEALLSLYLEYDVKGSLSNVSKIEDKVQGYYAYMVFNPVSQTVDIIKDSRAELYFAHVPSVGMVFCTSEAIIKGCCGKLKIKQPDVYTFPSNCAMRWTHGAAEIETRAIETKRNINSSLVTVTDVSKEVNDLDKWCEHGELVTGFCYQCRNEEWAKSEAVDLPSFLGGK